MIHNIPKPEISPNFTIDDIHKIREWHYEMLKDATSEERKEFYRRGAEEARRTIDELRRSRHESTLRH